MATLDEGILHNLMATGEVPPETREIVIVIGVDRTIDAFYSTYATDRLLAKLGLERLLRACRIKKLPDGPCRRCAALTGG